MKKVIVCALYAFTMIWFSHCKQGREAVAGSAGPGTHTMPVISSANGFADAGTYGFAGDYPDQ